MDKDSEISPQQRINKEIEHLKGGIAGYCQETGEPHGIKHYSYHPYPPIRVSIRRFLTNKAKCKHCGKKIRLEQRENLRFLGDIEDIVEEAFQ